MFPYEIFFCFMPTHGSLLFAEMTLFSAPFLLV